MMWPVRIGQNSKDKEVGESLLEQFSLLLFKCNYMAFKHENISMSPIMQDGGNVQENPNYLKCMYME